MNVQLQRGFRGLFAFVLTLSIVLAAAASGYAQGSNLGRDQDPMVVSGEALKGLWGSKLPKLRLMSEQGGKLVPVPFQVDKVDVDGKYIIAGQTVPPEVAKEVGFEEPPESEKRQKRIKAFEKSRKDWEKKFAGDKDAAQKLEQQRAQAYFEERDDELDYNDELVFMAKDAGGPVDRAKWPAPRGIELALRDPVAGGTGWLYLIDYASADTPPLSASDYVTYKPQGDMVESTTLRLDFVDDKPLVLEGGYPRKNGKELPNLVDRFKMRITLKPWPFFCASLDFDENNIRAVTLGYKDGPVRVIRRNLFWLVIAGIKLPFIPQAFVYYTFYENGVMGPTEIRNPIDPKKILCKGSVGGGGIDFRSNMTGARVYTPSKSETKVLNVRFDEKRQDVALDHQYSVVALRDSDGTAFLIRVEQGPELKAAGVNQQLFLTDNPEVKMKPEVEPGARYTGFGVNVLQVPKGVFYLYFYMYLVNDFKAGDEAKFMNILDKPVEVKTNI